MGQMLLETLSRKQILLFTFVLFLATAAFFVIGGTKGMFSLRFNNSFKFHLAFTVLSLQFLFLILFENRQISPESIL